ncbi:MAG: asparaginase [Bacteroidia bacterium]|nr:asparaginase [Bacteroidia bacterium]
MIITTGGTIASQIDAPLVEGPALVQAVPELLNHADIEVEEFVRIGSSKMTPVIWLSLVKRIRTLLVERKDLTAIVITHGTDSMEETSFFLNLTHISPVPIVMVGSMRSSDEISADGPANLLHAVRVSISPEAIGKGVLVVMNNTISAARDLLKMHNNRVDAFPPPESGYLGIIDNQNIIFYRSPVKPHTTQSIFDVYDLDSLPSVDILQDFAGFDKEILNYFLNRNNEGLVISSFAGGRTSNGINQIYNLPNDHRPVVISSSIKYGRIRRNAPSSSPIIIARDLPANKARILLMLALTKTQHIRKIQEIFDEY